MPKTAAVPQENSVRISAPNLLQATFTIQGNAPYVQNKFSEKAKLDMKRTQEKKETRKSKERPARDFEAEYYAAMHISSPGEWHGIPAPGFRAGLISACRVAGFVMTQAKLAVFIKADGFGDEGTPLVKITEGEPHVNESVVRYQRTSTDLCWRPMWDPGWQAKPCVVYDADMFSLEDVTNLLMRCGQQVGIGEGRPDSKSSAGMGWGTFDVLDCSAPKEAI